MFFYLIEKHAHASTFEGKTFYLKKSLTSLLHQAIQLLNSEHKTKPNATAVQFLYYNSFFSGVINSSMENGRGFLHSQLRQHRCQGLHVCEGCGLKQIMPMQK